MDIYNDAILLLTGSRTECSGCRRQTRAWHLHWWPSGLSILKTPTFIAIAQPFLLHEVLMYACTNHYVKHYSTVANCQLVLSSLQGPSNELARIQNHACEIELERPCKHTVVLGALVLLFRRPSQLDLERMSIVITLSCNRPSFLLQRCSFFSPPSHMTA
jgi:hypothetical protein